MLHCFLDQQEAPPWETAVEKQTGWLAGDMTGKGAFYQDGEPKPLGLAESKRRTDSLKLPFVKTCTLWHMGTYTHIANT